MNDKGIHALVQSETRRSQEDGLILTHVPVPIKTFVTKHTFPRQIVLGFRGCPQP